MQNVENPHLACHIFEAWVSVGNKALTQYTPKHSELDDGVEASCWIASENDQVSRIQIYLSPAYNAALFRPTSSFIAILDFLPEESN